MSRTIPIITIDGPSGSGKGTLAARLAHHYSFHLLDSGALYRVLGLSLDQRGLINHLESHEAYQHARQLAVCFQTSDTGIKIALNGQDVSDIIRTEHIGRLASQVAAIAPLRQALLDRQRDCAKLPGLVADGRDMGTLVFPNACAKLFLTASLVSRAQRRFNQLQALDNTVRIDAILADLEARDARDMQRAVAPLLPASDAFIIDSSALGIDEVFEKMRQYIDARL